MSLSGYSDLASWVKVLDDRLAALLADRLTKALESWNLTFKVGDDTDEEGESKEVDAEAGEKKLDTVVIPEISVEILLRNQEISAVPAVPTVRSLFLNKLHDFIGIVCNLQRPKSGRYEIFGVTTNPQEGRAADETFVRLIYFVPAEIVQVAYGRVEERIADVGKFIDQWLAYQTLWDTRVANVAANVGNDIEKWQTLLVEKSEARSALDLAATVAEFGPVAVNYNKVQSQINLKYDSWQKELQGSFATVLSQCIHDAHQKMEDAKTKLETATLESSSGTENIVMGLTFIQEMKQLAEPWMEEITRLEGSEKLLRRQRHHFRSDWMETSVVKGNFDLLQQILERRNATVEQQFPLLQARVSAEEKASTRRASELIINWGEDKPLRGNMAPSEALGILAKFQSN